MIAEGQDRARRRLAYRGNGAKHSNLDIVETVVVVETGRCVTYGTVPKRSRRRRNDEISIVAPQP